MGIIVLQPVEEGRRFTCCGDVYAWEQQASTSMDICFIASSFAEVLVCELFLCLCCEEYRKVQVKEGTLANVHPQLTVKGSGFSRLLGGMEIDVRLQQHLARQFEV